MKYLLNGIWLEITLFDRRFVSDEFLWFFGLAENPATFMEEQQKKIDKYTSNNVFAKVTFLRKKNYVIPRIYNEPKKMMTRIVYALVLKSEPSRMSNPLYCKEVSVINYAKNVKVKKGLSTFFFGYFRNWIH